MKYPQTLHLPWSPGLSRGDKRAKSIPGILGTEIVISEKLDGSNVCLSRERVFARTHSSRPTHESFDCLKAIHAVKCRSLPAGVQLFGEWCYAVHTIKYADLPRYLFVIGVLDGSNWWNWDEIESLSSQLGLSTVPVLFRGSFKRQQELISKTEDLAGSPSIYGGEREGLVVRKVGAFPSGDFSRFVFKWVRKDHVQSDEHWLNKPIDKNRLRKGAEP